MISPGKPKSVVTFFSPDFIVQTRAGVMWNPWDLVRRAVEEKKGNEGREMRRAAVT